MRKFSFPLLVFTIIGSLGLGLVLILSSCRSENDKYVDQLSAYIENQPRFNNLEGRNAAVYIDFSDGLNYAFAAPETQTVLKNIVDKINNENTIKDFYSLANNEITTLDNSCLTRLYNTIMNPASFENHSAPIQKALEQIVANKQPALLITDFEEYNGGQIQQAAYAKTAFTNWLKDGYNITFYKWDFTEGNHKKEKKLFIVIFDDQQGLFANMVTDAILQSNPSFIEKFVLGGKNFQYPMVTNYLSSKQGGGFHDEKGGDPITGIKESGGKVTFTNYAQPVGDATGVGDYAPLNYNFGHLAQFYPLSFEWKNIVKRVNRRKQHNTTPEFHFLQNLYVNFKTQNGYDIKAIEARVFDVNEAVMAMGDTALTQLPDSPAIMDMFVGIAAEIDNMIINGIKGWTEILVDFDERFTADKLPTGLKKFSDLIRINIVISRAEAETGKAREFFGWPGNNSLVSSVINTLESPEVNPAGQILITYYIKNTKEKN